MTSRTWLALALGLVVAVGLTGPAMAHQGTNHGTIKVQDSPFTDPSQRNQPHVSCDFYIRGMNMADDSGHLVFYEWPPTGDKSEVTPTGDDTNWTGLPEGDGDGFSFFEGPFQLPAGHYRVEAYLDDGHPGNRDHFAKAKMFWVEPCVDVPPDRPDCPPLTAIAEPDGDIRLEWTMIEDADEYRVYLEDEEGDFQLLDVTTDTMYTYTDTVVGETYTFAVTAVVDGVESNIEPECTATATAIPFFPGMAAGAVAVLGSLGALRLMRRRA